jgi:hypothetical protein
MSCIKMFVSDLPLLIFTDHFLYGTHVTSIPFSANFLTLTENPTNASTDLMHILTY